VLTTVIDLPGLQALIDALQARGRHVIGPTLRDSAIVLAGIDSVADLPRGIADEQSPGHYRTTARADGALFGYAAPAQSAKQWLFPPDELLWRGTRPAAGAEGAPAPPVRESPDGPGSAVRPLALLGIRSCDLAALGIHDTVLLGRAAADARYAARRADSFVVAVTCGTPAGTCFCASMGTGPKPGPGADIVLTELLDGGRHRFLAEAGTPAGEALLAGLPGAPAARADREQAQAVVDVAVDRMGRELDTTDLRDLLYGAAESPRWQEVADRCLACTNCTMVCPTCFCTSVEDVSDLSGDVDERHRVWDSCFSLEYSKLHGGSVRTSGAARYRQWLTHKLAAWIDQFGTSGCVGCGRCITWCPVGIDITAEVTGLREEASHRAGGRRGTSRTGPAKH
jgi:sulfhydrogenase subunit beta (sulfur reductase)